MKKWWIASLGLSLGILASGVRGDDGWNSPPPTRTPPASPAPAVTLGKPIAAVTPSHPASNTPVANTASVVNLGRPVSVPSGPRPLGSPSSNAIVDPNLQRTAFDQSSDPAGGWVTRASSPDASGPKPMPAGPRIETTTQLSNYQPPLQPADVPAAPAKELLPAPQSAVPSQQVIPAPQFPGNFDTLPPGTIISDPQMGVPDVSDGQLTHPQNGLHPQDGFPGHGPEWAPGHPQNGIIYDPCECVDGCNVDCKCDCQCDCKCGCGCYPGNRFYVSGEYLGWWTKGSQLPPLLTTASGPEPADPALNLPARTGALGLPNTQVVYGNNNVSNDFRSGARIMAGYWFDRFAVAVPAVL
jgi:Putative beta barrel porin-7 (BBP7)